MLLQLMSLMVATPIVVATPQSENVVYSDEDDYITLSIDELNNYSWVHFSQWLTSLGSVNLDNYIYFISDFNDEFTLDEFIYDIPSFNYYFEDDTIGVAYEISFDNNVFTYRVNQDYLDDGEFEEASFNKDWTLWLSSECYDDVKTAIQLDIEDNQITTPTNEDILEEIVDILVGGITGIATGIGNGVSELVGDLFLNATGDGLGVFGAMVVIFGGLSLAIGLSRWVMNFLTSLGKKK